MAKIRKIDEIGRTYMEVDAQIKKLQAEQKDRKAQLVKHFETYGTQADGVKIFESLGSLTLDKTRLALALAEIDKTIEDFQKRGNSYYKVKAE